MAKSPLHRIGRFFRELKRRKVYQVTAVYVVLAVGVLELLDLLIPSTALPGWAGPLILSMAIVGLPVVLVLAWTFDITPGGVVRTADEGEEAEPRPGDASEGAHGRRRGPSPAAPATKLRGSPASRGTARVPPAMTTHVPGARHTEDAAASEAPSGTSDADTPEQDELDPMAVAVLPFDNLSGSPDAEPFVVGLHDDLLTELSRASALTVISRTSVRGYRGTDKGMRQIGRELGAGTIVEGGVQKAGDRVRLNVQLIDARSDMHRWAERYDRELTAETIFELQSELAANIMAALEAQLTAAEESRRHNRPTDDLEAYRLYHLGRDIFVDRSKEGIEKAVHYFEAALERDPAYAHAWAGLGMALIALLDYGHETGENTADRGKAASFKAVELDPDLPEAHAAVGNYYGYVHDGPAAREALTRAMRLGPGLVLGYQWASWIDLCTGAPESALSAALRATQLDPLEPEARANLAQARLALGDPTIARDEARRLLETRPSFTYGHWICGLAEHVLGRHEEAHVHLDQMTEPYFHAWATLSRGLGHVARGRESEARPLVDELEGGGDPFEAAVLSAALRDDERFFSLLDRAQPLFWDEALPLRYWHIEPLERLRDDPRYRAHVTELDREWGVDG